MILAAGLGTRLKPLTNDKPKALVEVNNRPMLDIVIQRLVRSGFREIIVNVHYFSDQVIAFLKKNTIQGIRIEISDESDQLLDTGGAIVRARSFLDGNEPFLLHNTDVICDIDLEDLFQQHRHRRALATLAVSKRQSSRHLLMDNRLVLKGWENTITNERILTEENPGELQALAFSGIHVISPEIFRYIKKQGKFSIVRTYLQLAASYPIYGYLHDPDKWFDLGKLEEIAKAEAFLRKHPEF